MTVKTTIFGDKQIKPFYNLHMLVSWLYANQIIQLFSDLTVELSHLPQYYYEVDAHDCGASKLQRQDSNPGFF